MTSAAALDWQAVVARSPVARWLVILLSTLLLVLLGWFASLGDIQQAYRLALRQGHDARLGLQASEAVSAGLQAERQALVSARQMLVDARWRLDAGEAMSDLLDQLAVSGHAHGLLFERIDVQPEQPVDGYRRVPLEIRVVGHYPSLRGWLEQWLQQLRLLEVVQVSLAALGDGSGLVRAQILVRVYHPGEALPAPASLAEEPARPASAASAFDPFRPWLAGPLAEGVGRLPLEQLKMVGSLSRAGRYQALVDAGGRLYRVVEGQRLGRDEGVVVGIDAQRIEVRERLYMAGGWQQRSRYLVLGKGAHGEVMDEMQAGIARDVVDAADERQPDAGGSLRR